MSGLFKTIKNLFAYKEPQDIEGFELLEGENERDGQQEKNNPDAEKQEDTGKKGGDEGRKEESKEKKDKNSKKIPLPVGAWNDVKKENKATLPQASGKTVAKELKINHERIKQEFGLPKNQDVIIREFRIVRNIDAFILFIDGMADKTTINDFILRQLMESDNFKDYSDGCPIEYIKNNVLSINQITLMEEYEEIFRQVLNGLTAIFVDGCDGALLVESRGYEKRNVDMPATETVIRGSHEGFVENLRTNLTLIRKIIKNKKLVTEITPVGNANKINCGIMYIEGLTNTRLVSEVKRRIKSIDVDFVGGDGMINQLVEDNLFVPFPQVLSTERPDRAASYLMDGQVIFVTEGTPFASAVPATFFHFLQTPEDSFLRWEYGTLLRYVRLVAVLFAAFVPGAYIALVLYHQEMLPTDLLASIAMAREKVPFPSILELLIMEISFELIREAGIRVPGVIGQTLGIIGAVVLGQAAVAANLVSPILIIIIAITGLGSFAIPNYSFGFAIRILRFTFIFLGAIAGFYGIAAGMIIFGGIACSMKSFGVPYFSPVAPRTKFNPDVITRQPISKQKMRPDFLNPVKRKSAGNNPRGWTKK